jgi:hypothetical protein
VNLKKSFYTPPNVPMPKVSYILDKEAARI